MNIKIAQILTKKFGSPLYLFDMNGLLARFNQFQTLATAAYPRAKVAISYKTNTTFGLLSALHQAGAYAEVVSGYEYQIAQSLGQTGDRIIFNGPMKIDEELTTAITSETMINCDHCEEVERVIALSRQLQKPCQIGLRVSFHQTGLGWSRFGFDTNHTELIQRIVHLVQSSKYVQLVGLHAHIGTNIRDIKQFAQLGQSMAQFAQYLTDAYDIELKWLDVGGGLAGVSPRIDEQQHFAHGLPDLKAYINAVVTPLLPYLNKCKQAPTLFFEPGRTLFEPFGMMLTQVIGMRQSTNSRQTAVLNAGTSMLATTHVYNHPVAVIRNEIDFTSPSHKKDDPGIVRDMGPLKKQTILLGPSCNQADQLHECCELSELHSGDFVLFKGIGAYCMTFSYTFIRLRPGIVAWYGDDKAEWLRYPETFSHMQALYA